VEHLEELAPLDLWLVTAVRNGVQTVVAAAGTWSGAAPPGLAYPWQDSLCLRMVERRGPVVAPDVAAVPAYAEVAVGPLAGVRAYVGVPLEGDDGVVFGTLCGFAGHPKDASWDGSLGSVRLVGRMLSTILAREQFARARSHEAAAAYALVERDPVTGLRNRRGWDAAVEQEDTRCQRYGAAASVLVLELEPAAGTQDGIGQCADVLARSCRPGDVLARLGTCEFAVLALECDPVAARALHARLRVQLRTAGLSAATAVATRRAGERLADAWTRAGNEVARERQRRPRS
jgi:diguanylate cyclase